MSFLRAGTLIIAGLVLTACASGSTRDPGPANMSDACAAGETLICEVPNTGRIKHGSFSKGSKKCACQRTGETGPPIIPQVP
jgi:hypothetical protein